VVLAIPYILYQLWAFVAPGLYKHEKTLAMPLVVSSTLLFYLGMAFAYFVVFPLIFAFFTATAPEGVAVMTDISRYLDFVIMLFIAFGIAFEVPIATILLVSMGATTPEKLARKRPYVIVGTFVIGMILTPPDIISQTLLALPMWILFEIGLVLSRIMLKRKADRLAAEGLGPDPDDDGPPRGGPGNRPGGGPGSGGHTPRPDTGKTIRQPATSGSATATAGAGAAATAKAADTEFRPLTPEEMDAELDRLEEEDSKRAAENAKATDATTAEQPGAGKPTREG
jgi:sec-independent protein translocase protein TatC